VVRAAAAWLSMLCLPVPALAQPGAEQRQIEGLRAPAEIRIDRWGVAHITAATTRDAFFLQGYNAARDRLWQIDLWRKRGLGLLAEQFGPGFAEQDRAARLFLYRGSMAREWAAYPEGARAATEDFVRGINAYIGEMLDGTQPLPTEFRMTGTRPALWRAEDVVRIRSHALARNLPSEVARSRVACAADLEADRLRQELSPDHRTQVPEGLDPCSVPDAVLVPYRLATASVRFDPEALRFIAEAGALDAADAQGSNAWVVAPERTSTGRPILASDPHREHGLPSLRYVVHLSTPSWSIIGAGEPALPGVAIGHNGNVAFGLTFSSADQEDLYVYTLHPTRDDLYLYRGRWERMRRVRETIAVRGEAPRQTELLFTRHGPVTHIDTAARRAFAVRTVWSEPGTSAYFASVGLAGAQNVEDLRRVYARWGTPASNQLYADAGGQIGGLIAGRVPVRPGWDGLMPVPGDGRYEWAGFVPPDRMPQPFAADRGWVASANEMNIGPSEPAIGYEWPIRTRFDRIGAVLSAGERVSVADMAALQTDSYNILAAGLGPVLVGAASEAPDLAPAIALLADWDGRMEPASAGAALFETWTLRHLGRTLVGRIAPEAARPLIGSGNLASISDLILRPDARLGEDPAAARDAILRDSLRSALADLTQRLGPDMSQWAWGRLHHAQPQHPLQALGTSDAASLGFDRQPLAGGYLTVRASAWRPEDFRSFVGASFRMVVDVGAWDNSRFINAPGQSGDPASPHFRDHFPLWTAGDYVPLLYSPEAIARETETRLRLTPAR